jgi:putative alpha-1,2-mannosidase
MAYGNDDTGTMSTWLVYSMMGIYPIAPGQPLYTVPHQCLIKSPSNWIQNTITRKV